MAEEQSQTPYIIEKARKFIIHVDMAFHIIAALFLLLACTYIMVYAAAHLLNPSRDSVILLINDVLLALIILELLWTVNRFLKKQKFVLGPFFAVGIIAALRRILLIEAQTSAMEHVPVDKLWEMGLSSVVILLLIIAYMIAVKAQKLEQ